ncbi:MAG: DNA-directed RNA polymerase subunit omega [Clostridiales bacterium]|nr:DNA-directed RNA polymerase subunit omega [Clostridiales bacterium]
MLHPSYSDLMKVVNSEVEEGETPVVNSRYSIVMATSKRARQIIARQTGAGEDMREFAVSKPLSKAVEELYTGQLKIKPAAAEETDAETAPEIPEAAEEALPEAE